MLEKPRRTTMRPALRTDIAARVLRHDLPAAMTTLHFEDGELRAPLVDYPAGARGSRSGSRQATYRSHCRGRWTSRSPITCRRGGRRGGGAEPRPLCTLLFRFRQDPALCAGDGRIGRAAGARPRPARLGHDQGRGDRRAKPQARSRSAAPTLALGSNVQSSEALSFPRATCAPRPRRRARSNGRARRAFRRIG